MTKPVELSFEQTLGFDKFGQSVKRAAAHMKFSPAFIDDGCVGELKGAPLSCFVIVGLHEIKILLGQAAPLSLTEIERLSHYSRPSVTQALDYLVDRNYIVELSERGAKNEKQYRVRNYMWFGSNLSAQDIAGDGKEILPSENRGRSRENANTQAPQSGRSHNAAPEPQTPQNIGGRSRQSYKRAADNGRSREDAAQTKTFTNAQKIFSSRIAHVHDDDEIEIEIQNQESITSSSIHVRATIEKILQECGFEGVNVQRLAQRLDEIETAEQWAKWVQDPETLKRFTNPYGIAYQILMERPNVAPSFFAKKPLQAKRGPVVSGKLATWYTDEESRAIKR